MSTHPHELSHAAQRALDDFRSLKDSEYFEAWHDLPAPRFDELNGEYAAEFPPNFNDEHKRWQAENFLNTNRPNGYWLGKAFTPLGQGTGEGYNLWRMPDGRVERRTRFGTHLGTSRVDGRAALVMTYASFNAPSVDADTVDEVRRLDDGVFIGCATHRFGALQADGAPPVFRGFLKVLESYGVDIATTPEFHERTPGTVSIFVLTGPVEPYRGPDEST